MLSSLNINYHKLNTYFSTKALLAALALMPAIGLAQLSTNPDKFLGNITTSYQIDYGTEPFYQLWNQITPENESKWDQIEGNARGQFNWTNCDRIVNYARQHGFPFKFHTLVWGSQYPGWINSLSKEEQLAAITEWMDAVKKRYPDLQMIDVVNEAVAGHAPAPYKDALGGDGVTGYDWIIRAFEMAHERWPNAILIYNDYNTFQWNTDQFIDLVRILRNAGAPIDAYGCQSHDLTGCSLSTLRASCTKIQNALKMPMYITEYDIGTADDQLQLTNFSEQIPYLWELPYCAGVTLWGYIYGKTWTTDGNSGLIRNGQDRPAMTWLRQYMQSEKARTATSPFPGMVKEASVYVRPSSLSVTKGQATTIEVRASMRTKTIDHVDLYVDGTLLTTMTEAPYIAEYIPTALGAHSLKAIVTTTDGSRYERLSAVKAYNERSTFAGVITLPGTVEAENFDRGGEGLTFHDSDTKDEGGANYRKDNGGVDIVKPNSGYAIGYTASGEWMEYTVNVEQSGYYEYQAIVASGTTGAAFNLYLKDNGNSQLIGRVEVPKTDDGQWSTYAAIAGMTQIPLEAGQHVLRISVDSPYANIDKVVFTHTDFDPENQNFNSLAQLAGGQPFAIVDMELSKAFYGSGNQNLGFGAYGQAFSDSDTGYYFRLESLANSGDQNISNCYLLRLLQTNGTEYSIWGSPGYLNTQPATGNCCFILGLNNQYGQDIKYGAVWDIQYVEGRGFTLRNIGTGLYLHDNTPAKYSTPAYFNFCTKGYATDINEIVADGSVANANVYTLQGLLAGTRNQWNSLPSGLYIVNGRKVVKRD